MIKVRDCRGGWLKSRNFNLEFRVRIYVENFVSIVVVIFRFVCILLV